MTPTDDEHQAQEILSSIVDDDIISEFISNCLNSPGVNRALYSIFACHDYHKEVLFLNGIYDSQARVEAWHRALLTAFAVGVTISRSFTKLENTFWAEEK